ncbi:MAG: hypothetical protein JRI65_11905 [Deltaproteobacteria bacterium]|nr:hypothetical protein [Deltaproteobacteria bacterium]
MTYISQARFSRKQTTTGKGMSKYQSISGRRSAIIEDVSVECLAIVQREVREARLAIQSGEATSIAYILQGEEDITFCLCDKAAIKLMSFMDLDKKSISVEEAVREAGHHTRLLPRHRESEFRACIKEGKVLRIQLKNLI